MREKQRKQTKLAGCLPTQRENLILVFSQHLGASELKGWQTLSSHAGELSGRGDLDMLINYMQ